MDQAALDTLFAATLVGEPDDESAWDAVQALRTMATREVFERAQAWCQSAEWQKRQRGADIIAQFGVTMETRHPYPVESYQTIYALVQNEQNDFALAAGIFALGHLDNPDAVSLIARHSTHDDPEVRYAVAFALGSLVENPESIKYLLQLTKDADEDVRDWATFGIGDMRDDDTPEIREALFERLFDDFPKAKLEAIIGLAKRRDMRVLPHIFEALEAGQYTYGIVEAAYLILGLESEPEEWQSGEDCLAALRKKFS